MSAKDAVLKEQEQILIVFLAFLSCWFLVSIGPLVVMTAAAVLVLLAALRASSLLALMAAAVFLAAGFISDAGGILILGPYNLMQGFYLENSPGGLLYLLLHPGELGDFLLQLWSQAVQWSQDMTLWLKALPLGGLLGAGIYSLMQRLHKHPLGHLKKQKSKGKGHGKVGTLASNLNNTRNAHTLSGSIIGADKYARIVELTDKAANQHTLVLGTTGSGKTVTVCNIVESAINRDLPLIYIDGKGDYDLAQRVKRYAEEKGRPVSVFSMRGESIPYNPLATGGFTSKKDRIVALREWSEEHYKKLAEGYLQSVFKMMEACNIPCNLSTLAENLDIKRLKGLVRENENIILNAQKLMDELNDQNEASKSIESLVAEIRNFTASEIGPLFEVKEEGRVLTLADVLQNNGIAYFCLPALEFPSMSQTLGRLVINDLKATMAQQLANTDKKKNVYVVFDEFSVFAGEQVLNVINMGRSAGIHAVLSTQSLSDIASGRKENADHFINQVVANCNNFILHRQNSPEDAERLAAMMGTHSTLEYTAQVSQSGPTHMGTVRKTRGFIAHPDEIKTLGTGEAFFFSKENNKIYKIKARKSWV